MTEYWKSNAKKFCEICKIWIADNKVSVERHEQGLRHKGSVQQRIRDSDTRAREKEREQADLAHALIQMEQAAHASMMAESRSQRSAVADQRQLQQQLWREEREREQERIREAVMQKAGMVTQRDESHRGGGGGGGGQGGSGGSGTVVGVEEDPRAVQYREMIERKKREEREAEEERIRLLCEQKASMYQAKQEVQDAERRRQQESSRQTSSKSTSSHHQQHSGSKPKPAGPSGNTSAHERKRPAIPVNLQPASEGATELPPPPPKEKEVLAAPEIGPWVLVVPSKQRLEEPTGHPFTSYEQGSGEPTPLSKEALWKEEADQLEAKIHDPKEFAFAEKTIAEGSVGRGKSKVVEFKKRKLPNKGNIRGRSD